MKCVMTLILGILISDVGCKFVPKANDAKELGKNAHKWKNTVN